MAGLNGKMGILKIAGKLSPEQNAWLSKQLGHYDWQMNTYYPDQIVYTINGLDSSYQLGISYLYTNKIPKLELDKAPWINFHPGPLPEMGGRNLAYHAIMEQKQYFGATIHYMNEDFDKGPIIECERFPIKAEYNAGDLVRISHDILDNLLRKYLPKFLRGEFVSAQPNENGHYYEKMPIQDEIWLDGQDHKRIRALECSPHHPYIMINGQKYKIERVEK